MSAGPPHYSIDTSALIDWWQDYPPEVFPGLVPKLESLVAQGRLRAVRDVKDEIRDADDPVTLAKWCKAQPGFYLDDAESIQVKVGELMGKFQVPKKPKGIGKADPFVIAHAALNGAAWHVVSSEKLAVGNAHLNPNIPYVCKEIGVTHIRFLDMLRLEGWKLT